MKLFSLAASRIDARSEVPLYRQIYEALRRDILTRAASPGQRLVATREMAEDLDVSRNTVLEAIEQLMAEGYLTSRVGAGTFVAENLPEDLLRVCAEVGIEVESGESPGIAARGQVFRAWSKVGQNESRSRPFQLGRPAVDQFPWKIWTRLMARRARQLPRDWLDYNSSAGYPPLRKALARYLRSSRGLACSPDQIVIVRGSQQGLDLVTRILLDEGDPVWIEDPGYRAAQVAFTASGARDIPVPVDDQGLRVDRGKALEPHARLAYVTPSHQYPLGVTLSLPRRLELLQWAREARSWIVEDDYDSEYRFGGRPLASLAGLDGCRNVIYLGTLSKVLFPALRLGYLVVPQEHVEAFIGARYVSDRHTWTLEQAVVADFFDEGHFGRHVRRMRLLYAKRQLCLQTAIDEHLSEMIDLRPSTTGLHDVGWLKHHHDDIALAEQAADVGVTLCALSSFCRSHHLPPALLLGYAGFPNHELEKAAFSLAKYMTR